MLDCTPAQLHSRPELLTERVAQGDRDCSSSRGDLHGVLGHGIWCHSFRLLRVRCDILDGQACFCKVPLEGIDGRPGGLVVAHLIPLAAGVAVGLIDPPLASTDLQPAAHT